MGSPISRLRTRIRDSIYNPGALLVAGYGNQMPTFQGQLNDRAIDALIGMTKNLEESIPTAPSRMKQDRRGRSTCCRSKAAAAELTAEGGTSGEVTDRPVLDSESNHDHYDTPRPDAISGDTTAGTPPVDNYLTWTKGFLSWALTLDHKRIGVMYLLGILTSFLVGGVLRSSFERNSSPQGRRSSNPRPTTSSSPSTER